ncbi:MAG: hypothetical protein II248_07680 [Paludibacteraceae bacterium]|nr:hypothetical protein [Paludibacteraceae bacterium]
MSQINSENVIRISKGFMKNFVIPAYKQLKPIIDKEMHSLSSTRDYIYGKHLVVNGKAVKDIWEILPSLHAGIIPYSFAQPNDHQERHWAKKTYRSLASLTLPTSATDFEELFEQVYTIFAKNGFKNAFLTAYDTARRIGYNMSPQVLPDKFVYLPAGAYKGAACLFGLDWISRNEDKKFKQRKTGHFARVQRTKFYYTKNKTKIDYFDGLNAFDIEDMLCIFFNVKVKNSLINLMDLVK